MILTQFDPSHHDIIINHYRNCEFDIMVASFIKELFYKKKNYRLTFAGVYIVSHNIFDTSCCDLAGIDV